MTVRDIGPHVAAGSGRVAGIMDVHVDPAHRRQGLATYLLNEALRQLSLQGVVRVEGHASEKNTLGIRLYEKLGLVQGDQATVFLKRSTGT